jgi:hypothetical protein
VNQVRLAAVRLAYASIWALCSIPAWAGRPLTVDDAITDDAGHGHLEAWIAREPGSTVYNLAPTYALIDGVELGALLARDTSASANLRQLQAKWRITPNQTNGCNTGAVVGWAHESRTPDTLSVNGLLTCRAAQRGNVHVNLGVAKARNSAVNATRGMAYEREFKPVTPSIEWFSEGGKPTLQAGLRGNVAKHLQLDGSIGRRDRATLYSLGTKLQF